jgi:hypothetical protein
MRLNESASAPVSSLATTGTRALKSPSITRAVALRRLRTGSATERESSTVNSNDSVAATTTATRTSRPRSRRLASPVVDSPATTTPVITLIAGIAASSLTRSGIGGRPRSAASGSAHEMSSRTGPIEISMPKKRSIAA